MVSQANHSFLLYTFWRKRRRNSCCNPEYFCDGAQIMKLYCIFFLCVAWLAILLHLVSGACIGLDLGMESLAIVDNNITASSVLDASTPAKNGRLNYIYGPSWCASLNDSTPYLQIDLQTLHIICAVSTQGNSQSDDWVKTYTLQTSTDGTNWTDYKENKQVKTFTGNNDRNTEKKGILYEGLLARLLRFVAKTSYNKFCMRTEVFGVKLKPENLAAGKATNQSSTYTDEHASGESSKAVDGNSDTQFNNGHCTHTLDDNPSWWRVDLGSDHVPVFEVRIVNRIKHSHSIYQRNKDYKITLGNNASVTSNPDCVGRYSFTNFVASAVCYQNPLTTGRYLGIMTTSKTFLQLCEVEIYSRKNLAFGKPTDQSTRYHSFSDANSAVDGDSNTNYGDGSCTHTHFQQNPWWRVDLGQVEPVTEVYIVNRGDCCDYRLNTFEIRVGTNSINGGVSNPKCGDGGYSVPRGQGTSFFCRPSLYGRYVTIRITKSTAEYLTLCEVEVYSARRACQIQSIGVTSSYEFPSDRFSASSSTSGNEPSKARLNGNGAWSPSSDSNANDYLQINLQHEFFICAVATQGNPNADHWTTKYKMHLSLNNLDWDTYKENSNNNNHGVDKIFHANSGGNDIVKNNLVNMARAKFIRFQPAEFSTRKALRVELYGILKLAISVPQETPSNFSVTASTSISIVASWRFPSADTRNGFITGFKLFYRKKGSINSPTILTINSATVLTSNVTGLNKYTEYEFQVLAFTSAGDGPKTAVKVERTKEDVPSQAPISFTVTASTSTSVVTTWQPPPADARHGIITGFKLFYKKKGSADPPGLLVNNGANFIKVVTGLEKYTEYEFQVLAFTSAGDGIKSSVKVERTREDVPSQAPTNFSVSACSSTSIDTTWQLPPVDSRHGIITGFKLFYRNKASNEAPTIVPINNGVIRTKTVIGLAKFTEYEFQVLASTSAGDGPKSAVKAQRTKEDVPSQAPVNFTVTAKTSSSILASWQLPPTDSRNGIIAGFKLFYKKRGQIGAPYATLTINGATIYSKNITGLTKYTVYEFQVSAFTSAGDGPKSSAKVQRTKEGDPPLVRIPEKFILKVDELALLPCEVSGVPEPFVTWTKDGDSNISRAQFKKNGRVLVITDVLPGDRGTYECRASNRFGESHASTIVIVAVPPSIIELASSSSVICETYTLCLLSCLATSDFPVTYSWTKNDRVLQSDGNNTLTVRPREAEDYGVYVCNATNSYGSTAHQITLSEFKKSSLTARRTRKANEDNKSGVMLIVFSCVVVLMLVVIGLLLWRLRRQAVHDSSRGQHVPKPGSYMELDELTCTS